MDLKYYFDVCCLNRPFDDQSQLRIRLETQAIIEIFTQAERYAWKHVSSDMARIEISAIKDASRRQKAMDLMPREILPLDHEIYARAESIMAHSISPADAVHLSAAERLEADVFFTCDDALIRRATRSSAIIDIPIANPPKWLQEQMNGPHT